VSLARETAEKIELTRWAYASLNSRDFDALMDIFGPDSVWDVSRWGLGIHAGTDAIRRFVGDWFETLDAYEVQIEEMLDLGNGVIYAEVLQIARPAGSGYSLRLRSAPVFVWVAGVVARLTIYRDIDEARAAAERLAAARVLAMSRANVEIANER
jgi:ketosteroid isomerase-like protein